MDITGTYTFNAPPEKVWAMMLDPAAIASCIPGCDRLEPDGADRYKAAITIGMAAITGRYEGIVIISDKVEPSSYTLSVEGQGRPGFVKGQAKIALRGVLRAAPTPSLTSPARRKPAAQSRASVSA